MPAFGRLRAACEPRWRGGGRVCCGVTRLDACVAVGGLRAPETHLARMVGRRIFEVGAGCGMDRLRGGSHAACAEWDAPRPCGGDDEAYRGLLCSVGCVGRVLVLGCGPSPLLEGARVSHPRRRADGQGRDLQRCATLQLSVPPPRNTACQGPRSPVWRRVGPTGPRPSWRADVARRITPLSLRGRSLPQTRETMARRSGSPSFSVRLPTPPQAQCEAMVPLPRRSRAERGGCSQAPRRGNRGRGRVKKEIQHPG